MLLKVKNEDNVVFFPYILKIIKSKVFSKHLFWDLETHVSWESLF